MRTRIEKTPNQATTKTATSTTAHRLDTGSSMNRTATTVNRTTTQCPQAALRTAQIEGSERALLYQIHLSKAKVANN